MMVPPKRYALTKLLYQRNLERAPDMGTRFAQDIEPKGEYMTIWDPAWGFLPNREYGEVTFQHPLVLDWVSTGHGGWKTTLSEMFGGKRGCVLSSAVVNEGYDGIVTLNGEEVMEVVNLAGQKDVMARIAKNPKIIGGGLPTMFVKGTDAFIEDIVSTVGGSIVQSWEA